MTRLELPIVTLLRPALVIRLFHWAFFIGDCAVQEKANDLN